MKRSVEPLSRVTRRIDFKTASSLAVKKFEMIFTATNFDISSISSSIFCDAQVKIFHAGSTETIFRISTSCSCWDLWQIPSQIVLKLKPFLYSTWFTFIEFVFNLVVACSFWVARVIKNTLRKPFEFKWPEVRFNRKQTSMTRVPYNKLLTNLASSSRTGEYWPSVVLYLPRCARSVLSRPRANIPRYGPRARLVRGYWWIFTEPRSTYHTSE